MLACLCGCQSSPELRFQGDSKLEKISLQNGQPLSIEGQGNSVTVVGKAGQVRVNGQEQFVRLDQGADSVWLEGKGNQVEVQGSPRKVTLRGQGHRVVIHEQKGQPRPLTDVQGSDQSLRFVPQEKHEVK